jgi:hypothetical protein
MVQLRRLQQLHAAASLSHCQQREQTGEVGDVQQCMTLTTRPEHCTACTTRTSWLYKDAALTSSTLTGRPEVTVLPMRVDDRGRGWSPES